MSIFQTETENDNLTLTFFQITKQRIDVLSEHHRLYITLRGYDLVICNKIAQVGIILFTD